MTEKFALELIALALFLIGWTIFWAVMVFVREMRRAFGEAEGSPDSMAAEQEEK